MRVRRALVRRARAVTLAAIALGTLLRLTAAFPAAPLRMAPGDEWFYWERSEAIQLAGDPENAWQPPLYSYAIAAWRAAGADSVSGARGLNVVLYAIAAAGLVALAAGWSRALVPSVVLALHPVLVGFAGLLLSETLFAATLFWALALQRRSSGIGLVGAGVMWGLAALTRELALPFFALAVLLHARVFPSAAPGRAVAVLVASFALTLCPWLVRNQLVLGAPVLTTSRGFNLWVGNEREVSPAYAWHAHKLGVHYRHYLALADTELERDAIALGRALRFIREEQPLWIARKSWEGLSHLLEPDNYLLRRLRNHGYGPVSKSAQRGVALVALAGELAVVFWGSFTLLSLRPSGRRRLVVLMFAAGALVHLITLSDSRHRLGLELLFFLVAGCRFQPRWMVRRRARQALLLTAAVAVLGLLTPGRQQLFDLLF